MAVFYSVFFLIGSSLTAITAGSSIAFSHGLTSSFCPIATCDCDGLVMDCSYNNWETLGLIIVSSIWGDENTDTFYRSLLEISLEGNQIHHLLDVQVLQHYIPNLSRMRLDQNPINNCSEVDIYRWNGIEIESDLCPMMEYMPVRAAFACFQKSLCDKRC